MEAKRYGVLFYPIVNKVEKTGTVEIMAKAKDAKQINRIFERMGYPAPVKEDTVAKKRTPALRPRTAQGARDWCGASTEPAAEKADARPLRPQPSDGAASRGKNGMAQLPPKDTVRGSHSKGYAHAGIN